ncbi:Heavy metal-associated isoprenylated plant protein 45 [Citrus sinensis]|nr:heavy metal-associated isoprenylated plant protein 28 isoform X2 [Citrus x clementina]XP_006474356.1 heavy metal-associated isoprenylated plant protein 28-like [Citrus sinensis]KAH9653527.1 Heavy metal-associated isoprenylated plant protein 45 [Citrus sinensis]
MEVVQLKVRLHCKACEKAVRQALCRITGVKCVEIDTVSNKITVLGYMDRRVVIKAVQRTGRRAELLSSSSSSSSYYGLEEQSPRLPRGFRCIIPRCGFRSYLRRNNNSNVSGALPPKK